VVVPDPRRIERGLEPRRVRPRVLAAAHATPLPDVDQHADVGVAQRSDEARGVEAVDADRGEAGHGAL
jgi:hypothetical protein